MIKTPQKLLLDSFEKNLKKNALWDNEKFYTYKKILDFTKPIIKKLQYYNSKKVAVLNEKNIFCYCSILSIFLDNKIFVPLNHRFSNTKNIYILKKAKIDTILVGEQFLTKAIELKKILKKNGFDYIQLSKIDWYKQIYMFNNAKTIIGLHGAGLANLVFCRKNTKIYEILVKNHSQINLYKNISKKIRLNYKKIIIPNKKNKKEKKIELNINILKRYFINE